MDKAQLEALGYSPEQIEQILALQTPTDQELINQGFTKEDIERAREQEKAKLYPQLKQMRDEIDGLRKKDEDAAEARRLEEETREAERAAEKKAAEEAELSAAEIAQRRVEELRLEIEAERSERLRSEALLAQERTFNELQAYRTARLEQERANINPELWDFVGGNSREEIDESIAVLIAKTASIMESVTQASVAARQALTGARVTNPAGPLDNTSEHHTFTPDRIAAMSPQEYAQNRHLINPGAAANRGQGLFGTN